MKTELEYLDVAKVRADFPILQTNVRGKSLVYLDNAATTQKPRSVIEALSNYYQSENANVHRGVHYLSEVASEKYEGTRRQVQKFIGARSEKEIIFVRGTTEAINLIAQCFGHNFGPEDEVLISAMEHHSNIVPWQILSERTGVKLKVIPIDENGDIIWDAFDKLLSEKTKLVSMVHISNSLGTINPVEEVIEKAHKVGAKVLIDGAQAIAHSQVNVQELDCDFYVFSGHKAFAPTGIGVLYGKEEVLNDMPPYQGGGDMILSVSFDKTSYNELPFKFEAGTPNIAGVIGLGKALEYIESIGYDTIAQHENDLLNYATEKLGSLPGLKIIGQARHKAAVVSFVIEGVHPHDIGTIVDMEGVAIRTGHHCTQPVMEFFAVPATSRASFAFYNSREDVDRLCEALEKAIEMFC